MRAVRVDVKSVKEFCSSPALADDVICDSCFAALTRRSLDDAFALKQNALGPPATRVREAHARPRLGRTGTMLRRGALVVALVGLWAAAAAPAYPMPPTLRVRLIAGVPGDTRYFTQGILGDGGPATSAKLNSPRHAFQTPEGAVVFADSDNCRVREVNSSTGIIRLVAGVGLLTGGYSGDGGQAVAAKLNFPGSVMYLNGSGSTLLIADTNNDVIRLVSPTGVISTGISGVDSPDSLSVDGATQRWFFCAKADVRCYRVEPGTMTPVLLAGTGSSGFSGDGGLATAARLGNPLATSYDPRRNVVLIADAANARA